MAQGIIVSKNETKRIHQMQESFDKKIKDCRDFIIKVYDAVNNMDAETAIQLLKNVDFIETFVKETFVGRGANVYRCPYVLHGILAILSMYRHDFSNVLDKMRESDVATLKSIVVAAQKMAKPNVKIIKQNIEICSKERYKPFPKYFFNSSKCPEFEISPMPKEIFIQ